MELSRQAFNEYLFKSVIKLLIHGGQSYENERSQSADLAGLGNSRRRRNSTKAGRNQYYRAGQI